MSTEAIAAPRRTWRHTLSQGGAWVLVAGCVLMLGAIAFTGERATSYDDLQDAVAHHEVDHVRVTGGSPEVGDPFALAEVHWRRGPIARVSEVVETTSRSEAEESGLDAPIIQGTVEDDLSALDPDVRVTYAGDFHSFAELKSWRVPSWAGLVGMTVALSAFVLLVVGPQPWRATRWAWFWLLWTAPPLGILAFLLLGGSTRLWPPARAEARLTGGWAFLLTIPLGMALSAVTDAFL